MTHAPAHAAEGEEASVQYGRYEEGKRELFGERSNFDPIQVDSLYGSGGVTLFDRVKFAFTYMQDTWSGATPITTAPLAFAGNRNPDPGNPVSGASPIIDENGALLVDSQFNAFRFGNDPLIFSIIKTPGVVHTISSASPETRKQGDFRLGYEWDEAALDIGGGISLENDYESRWVNVSGRWDLNQKLTSLNMGLSYTNSDIAAILDHDASPYIDKSAYENQIDIDLSQGSTTETLRDERQDWSARFGLTQVLNKDSLIETSFGYTRSTGYLENPYKVVEFIFVDPDQTPVDFGLPDVPPLVVADVKAVLEQRPDERNQWTWDARYVHHVNALDAALHLDYRFVHDNWGIDAHTLEAAWGQPVGETWTITPRVRYYTQDEADFYQPFFLFKQAQPRDAVTGQLDVSQVPITQYSSDHRLSGYGALSGGLTVSKQFAKGVSLAGSFEYYTHEGGLKLGGGGEGDYADFDYYTVSAALKVDLSAPLSFDISGHEGHAHGDHHTGGRAPAGVMADHMLPQAGDFMVGYHYMYSLQGGDMLHGSDAVNDQAIINQGCGSDVCRLTAEDMSMHMHMLELMYAPTDWLNLMLMPQFVDMEMTLRDLEGAPPPPEGTAPPHFTRHSTGLVGDTSMHVLVKLFEVPGHHVHLGLGLSAPTGDVDLKLRPTHGSRIDEFIHYHMQLGSGTWDLLPSLTYTGEWTRWSWGGQLSGIHRLEDANESGYALGDVFQATTWGSYGLNDWLSASVRGVYTTQGAITGEFNGQVGHQNRQGPMDFPANHGGRYWDVGFGLNAVVPIGDYQGNHLSVEWIQPVEDDVNGYQLEREGTLFATWRLKF